MPGHANRQEDAIARTTLIRFAILIGASLATVACVDDDGTVFNGSNGDNGGDGDNGENSTNGSNGGDGTNGGSSARAPLHGFYEVVQHTESEDGCGEDGEDIRRSDYLFLDSSITDAFDVLRHDYNGYQCSSDDFSSCTDDGYLMFWVKATRASTSPTAWSSSGAAHTTSNTSPRSVTAACAT